MRPRRPGLLLHGQGQHRLPLGDLAGAAARPERRRATTAARRARSARSTCPTRSCRSEFLTMSGSKFSTCRGTVIYVGDFLREFGPDALRYFIAVAGPENQDTDFTWDEFVRRTNFELANEWGNLVNRSISMAHKNVGAIPKPTAPTDADAELLAASAGGVRHRRRPARAQPVQAGDRRGDAGGRRRPTSTSPTRSRGSARTTRTGATRSCTPRCRSSHDANTLLTPFLPHAAQQVHEALGGTGVWAAQPEIREVDDLGDGPALPGAHRRLRRRAGALGVARRSRSAARWPSRRRSSPSSTRSWARPVRSGRRSP